MNTFVACSLEQVHAWWACFREEKHLSVVPTFEAVNKKGTNFVLSFAGGSSAKGKVSQLLQACKTDSGPVEKLLIDIDAAVKALDDGRLCYLVLDV